MTATRWAIEVYRGSAAELHGREVRGAGRAGPCGG